MALDRKQHERDEADSNNGSPKRGRKVRLSQETRDPRVEELLATDGNESEDAEILSLLREEHEEPEKKNKTQAVQSRKEHQDGKGEWFTTILSQCFTESNKRLESIQRSKEFKKRTLIERIKTFDEKIKEKQEVSNTTDGRFATVSSLLRSPIDISSALRVGTR